MNESRVYGRIFTIPFRTVSYTLVTVLVFFIVFLDTLFVPQILTVCVVGMIHFEIYQLNHYGLNKRLNRRTSGKKTKKRFYRGREFVISFRFVFYTAFVLSFLNTVPDMNFISAVLTGVFWMVIILFECSQVPE